MSDFRLKNNVFRYNNELKMLKFSPRFARNPYFQFTLSLPGGETPPREDEFQFPMPLGNPKRTVSDMGRPNKLKSQAIGTWDAT